MVDDVYNHGVLNKKIIQIQLFTVFGGGLVIWLMLGCGEKTEL